MRPQCKQVWAKLVVQFPGDLLALDILQRDDALGQTPLVVDGASKCHRKMVQLGTDGRQFRRPVRCHAGIVAAGFDPGHRGRKRLNRRQRPADHQHRDEKERDGDRRADLELGHDAIPDLDHLIGGVRGDQE